MRVWGHLLFVDVGLVCLLGGGYAIWQNKDEANKPHLTSWHSYLGATAALLLLLQTVFSALGPMAPWGSGKYG